MKSFKTHKSFQEILRKDLKNPKESLGYLKAALEDEDKRVFLMALSDVAEAYGGMTKLSHTARISREHLYRIFSKHGNPEFATLINLLDVLGFKLTLEPKNRKLKKAA